MTRSSFWLRAAEVADAPSLADLQVRGWRETYTGLVPERVFTQMADGGVERWRGWLADPQARGHWVATDARPEHTGEPIGFAVVEARGPGAPRPLRLNSLYVLREHHGRGIGRALLHRATGDAPCYLWVAEENPGAIAFYERQGFGLDGGRKVFPEWDDLVDLRMVR